MHINVSDDEFDSDFDSAAEDLLPADEKDRDQVQHSPALLSSSHTESSQPATRSDIPQRSDSLTLADRSSRSPTLSPSVCAIRHEAPAYSVGPDAYSTCRNTCASKYQPATGLPNPSHSRTPGPPPNSTLMSLPSWPSEQTYSSITRPYPRPNQIRMCDVCRVRPRYQRGSRIYPTCGLTCAAKMHAPGSIEMCDYCKKRPKVVINGKTYPQCGRTCRDKAKLAKNAANAATCTSCILCWKSTKAGHSDFCSQACQSLADVRAPFLIEIPRGHVAFKQVAENFALGWQKSNTHCPTVKRIYMVVMKPSFQASFAKYRTKVGSQNGVLQRKLASPKQRWLVVLRECGFGDPGDLEPCSSKKCLLCCIVRSSFNRLDFPAGITTSALNRTVELYRSSKKSSLKIAALADVVVGREAEMTRQEVQTVHPIPPLNTDSVHIIGERNAMSDIIVYDGDAVKPLYLISYV